MAKVATTWLDTNSNAPTQTPVWNRLVAPFSRLVQTLLKLLQSKEITETIQARLDCYNNLRQSLNAETLTTPQRLSDTPATATYVRVMQRHLSLDFSTNYEPKRTEFSQPNTSI